MSRFAWRLSLATLWVLLAGATAPSTAQERAGDRGPESAVAPQSAALRGDGRGLATFGDRFTEGFSQRGLVPFSDTPLAPMGGFEAPGWSARAPSLTPRDRPPPPPRLHHRSRRFRFDRDDRDDFARRSSAPHSVASIRGTLSASTLLDAAPVALPAVALPAIVFDHRPALADLAAALRDEADRVAARGDRSSAQQLRSAAER